MFFYVQLLDFGAKLATLFSRQIPKTKNKFVKIICPISRLKILLNRKDIDKVIKTQAFFVSYVPDVL